MLKIRLSVYLVIASLLVLSAPLMVHAPPPDTTPPSIGTPIISPSSPSASDIVTIQVNVTDNHSVQNVTIVYTTDNWQSVNTTITTSYNATTTTATGQIPALTNGGHVAYYIVALDTAGNKQVNNNSGASYAYDVAAPPITSVTNAWLAIVAVAGVGLGVCIVSLKMLKKKPLRSHQSN
jgi:hypothetical protein